ncbi:YqcC family protein [Salinicola aestuarinus]|uniref:YqcC family protein n=1 Tax=Salinicola aestuarinus TaxID=1949082 RepID=UPI000DA214F1|nr:YqcC family protein [Salinicola aestuarinus]
MTAHHSVQAALQDLEVVLKRADLWPQTQPAPADFESTQPFCVDTMTLPQWLRFVFIARLQALLDAHSPLPQHCDVAPAMEVYLKDSPMAEKPTVIAAIDRVDRAVTQA